MVKMNRGQKISHAVVVLTIGAGLVMVALRLVPIEAAVVLLIFLAVELWLLVNSYKDDTLSESQWDFAARPLVPWLCGLATAWAITAGNVTDPWLVLSMGMLNAHFFWQSQDVYDKITLKRLKDQMMEEIASEIEVVEEDDEDDEDEAEDEE